MNKPTILYLNHVAYLGGAEIALLDLVAQLDQDRFAPVACVPTGALLTALQARNIRCLPIPVLPGLNRQTAPLFVWRLLALRRIVRRVQPDLLHANTNFTACYAGALAQILRLPTVVHIRDIEPFGRLGRRLIRQNTRLIAISDAVTQFLQYAGLPADRLVRVYDGVDVAAYRPSSASPPIAEARFARPTPDTHIIGIIGQLGARKGHLILLDALRRLIQAQMQVIVWIVGEEPAHSREGYTQQLQQYIAQHHLTEYVRFFGFRADIPAILAQLDLLVLPSLQEPFGKIVIEAMALAKPVVAARVGGVPEIVEDGVTGCLVPPADAAALAHALLTLLQAPETRHAMGAAGRARVVQHFNLTSNVRATEEIYAQILTR